METDSQMYRWPQLQTWHYLVSCAASRRKEVLETFLCSSFECGKLSGRFHFKRCDLRDCPHSGIRGNVRFSVCVLASIRIRVPQRVQGATWWQTDVWGHCGVVEITIRNVDNGISSYPGECEGDKGLMTSETCSFSTLPEMPNCGTSYQSREWNLSVDGFCLLLWQPAPLLNTLWKQFLLCNAG